MGEDGAGDDEPKQSNAKDIGDRRKQGMKS